MSRVGCQVCVLMKGTGNRVSVEILKFAKQMPKAFATGENKMPSRTFDCQPSSSKVPNKERTYGC